MSNDQDVHAFETLYGTLHLCYEHAKDAGHKRKAMLARPKVMRECDLCQDGDRAILKKAKRHTAKQY